MHRERKNALLPLFMWATIVAAAVAAVCDHSFSMHGAGMVEPHARTCTLFTCSHRLVIFIHTPPCILKWKQWMDLIAVVLAVSNYTIHIQT